MNSPIHYSSELSYHFIQDYNKYSLEEHPDNPLIETIKEHSTAEGAARVFRFKGREYVLQIHAVRSQVKVEKPQLLTADSLLRMGGLET